MRGFVFDCKYAMKAKKFFERFENELDKADYLMFAYKVPKKIEIKDEGTFEWDDINLEVEFLNTMIRVQFAHKCGWIEMSYYSLNKDVEDTIFYAMNSVEGLVFMNTLYKIFFKAARYEEFRCDSAERANEILRAVADKCFDNETCTIFFPDTDKVFLKHRVNDDYTITAKYNDEMKAIIVRIDFGQFTAEGLENENCVGDFISLTNAIIENIQ